MSQPKGLGELEKLTAGELLLVDRRRRGETQRQAARRLGVSHSLYSLWERDLEQAHQPPIPKLDLLNSNERCLLYRRRSKVTQAKVAADLNVCRYWLNRMERGEVPCDALIGYWEC